MALAAQSYYRSDPPNPALQGTAAYGHNAPGSFDTALPWYAGELIFLLAVLRPWSRTRTPKRFAIAIPSLGLWFGMLLFGAMHQGGVYYAHALWIFGAWLGCMVTVVYELVLGKHRTETD